MPYHYEISYGVWFQCAPDDVDCEDEVRDFKSMGNAIQFARELQKTGKADDVKLFLVFKDCPNGQLEDRCELPLKLA